MKLKIILIIIVGFAMQCASGTQYRKVSSDEGSGEWGPKEVQETVNTMVGALEVYLKQNEKAVFIQLNAIKNRTSEHIDTKMLADKIATSLVQRKIRFIDVSQRDAALKEIETGQTGIIDSDSAVAAGQLKSPNFFITGDITDNQRHVDGKRIQYLVVTLKLVAVATTEVKWQNQKEFLKETKEDNYTW